MLAFNAIKPRKEWTNEATFNNLPLSRFAHITVANQAVYVQWFVSEAHTKGLGLWTPGGQGLEEGGLLIMPGFMPFPQRGMYGIRVRAVLSNAEMEAIEKKKKEKEAEKKEGEEGPYGFPSFTVLVKGVNE